MKLSKLVLSLNPRQVHQSTSIAGFCNLTEFRISNFVTRLLSLGRRRSEGSLIDISIVANLQIQNVPNSKYFCAGGTSIERVDLHPH